MEGKDKWRSQTWQVQVEQGFELRLHVCPSLNSCPSSVHTDDKVTRFLCMLFQESLETSDPSHIMYLGTRDSIVLAW